ncbi:hypothetical protein M4D79_06885 [Mycolicibacterium novocastrense]|nr:hypothetical protein M4D79_06885 [Mycolicibacterium novocastrense]
MIDMLGKFCPHRLSVIPANTLSAAGPTGIGHVTIREARTGLLFGCAGYGLKSIRLEYADVPTLGAYRNVNVFFFGAPPSSTF